MARNKYPEETVQKILDVAFRLFSTRGFDKTSIQDIVDGLGMSKGAIYHHFKSKEEILQRLCDMMYEDTGWLTEIKSDPTLTGLQKIHRLFLYQLGNQKKLTMDIITANKIAEPHMLVESLKCAINDVAPLISELMEEGIRDGSITVEDPLEASETILLLANAWVDPFLFPVTRERYMRKVAFYQKLLTGIGVPMMNQEIFDVAVHYYDVVFTKAALETADE